MLPAIPGIECMAIFCEVPAVANFQLGSLCYLRSPCSLVSLGDTRRITADYDPECSRCR